MRSALTPFRQLPSEVQVMLLAARPRQGPLETAALKQLCGPGLDWNRVLALSLHHSLASLVQAGLSRCCPGLFPADVRNTFQQHSMRNALRAVLSMREAARLSAALAAAGHPVAVVKGVPLSQLLYGSPHLRHVGDLDLLTVNPPTPGSHGNLVTQFASLGYELVNPAFSPTPRRLRTYARFWKDLTFRHPAEGHEVDLHWRFFNHTRHPANRLLPPSSLASISACQVTVPVLPLPEQLLHIVAHGVNDAWIYLKSLADVAGLLALLSSSELDGIVLRASGIGLLPQLSAAVHLSNAWMGSEARPGGLLPQEDPLAALLHGGLSTLLQEHDFTPTRDDRTPAEWVRLERAQIPGSRALLENAGRFLWRPRVWQRFGLPDSLFWMYPALGLLLPPRLTSVRRSPSPRDRPQR